MKTRRVIVWAALALILAAGLTYAFWPRPAPVDLAAVAPGPLAVTIDEEGQTRVKDVFVLSAPVSGHLLRIDLKVGDEVIAGQTVVARIEPIDPSFLDFRTEVQAEAAVRSAEAARALAAAELEQAQAELDFARAELERAKRLIESKTISARALDEAERAYRTRKAAVATAQAGLRMRDFELEAARAQLVSPVETFTQHGSCKCVPIRAPVGGRILRVFHESEGVVQAAEDLVEIGDPSDLEIVVDLLSSDAVKVRPGQRVRIEEWGGDGALNGVVRRVEPYGFTKVSALGIEEQRVNVLIDFTDPLERRVRLGHGYRIEARIVVWQTDRVLKVPLGALYRAGDRWAVFLAQDGRARQRIVELGHRNRVEAEVLAGLSAGDRVVLHPSDMIADGVRITPRPNSR